MKKSNEVIRELREDRDFRQIDIAKLIGTTQQHYSRYERGESDFPTRAIILLADYYKVSTDYLLGRTECVEGVDALNEVLVKGYSTGQLLTDLLSLSDAGRRTIIEYIELQKIKENK